jgi:hypothetical protein
VADTKISGLTEGSAVADTDEFPAVETTGTGPVKKLATKIRDYVLGTGSGNVINKTNFFVRNDGWIVTSFGAGFNSWYDTGGGIIADATSGTTVSFTKMVATVSGTVSGLPSASGTTGCRRFVTDANATTFNSIVAGGGSNNVPVFSDGTNWRIG